MVIKAQGEANALRTELDSLKVESKRTQRSAESDEGGLGCSLFD